MDGFSFSNLFTPLSKEYCMYYYYLSILTYIFFVFAVFATIYVMITLYSKKELTFHYVLLSITSLISYFLAYFTMRLSYSMCVGSLHPSTASSKFW